MNTEVIYSGDFFGRHIEGAVRSARVVVPLVQSIVPVNSVIDVGCGLGVWAAEFLLNGVPDAWGVDGDYVQRSQLRIPPERFLARDLTQPFRIDRRFDLAVCLEVAEHLPTSRAAGLVDDLTRLAPCVLFSAAVPGPTGTHHINSQYLPYWVEHFQRRGYEVIDPIRPQIWGNDSVEWFYQENIVMCVERNHVLLSRNFPKPQTIIHQQLYEQVLHSTPTLRMIAKAFPEAVRRSLRYHFNNS